MGHVNIASLLAEIFAAIRFFFILYPIHIRLRGLLPPFDGIAALLVEHVVDASDGQQVKVSDVKAKLHTPEHKQSGCHWPLCLSQFFLAGTVVLIIGTLLIVVLGCSNPVTRGTPKDPATP
jgi:hypothetical protein